MGECQAIYGHSLLLLEDTNRRTQITSYMQKVKHLDYDHPKILEICVCKNFKGVSEGKERLEEKKKVYISKDGLNWLPILLG